MSHFGHISISAVKFHICCNKFSSSLDHQIQLSSKPFVKPIHFFFTFYARCSAVSGGKSDTKAGRGRALRLPVSGMAAHSTADGSHWPVTSHSVATEGTAAFHMGFSQCSHCSGMDPRNLFFLLAVYICTHAWESQGLHWAVLATSDFIEKQAVV